MTWEKVVGTDNHATADTWGVGVISLYASERFKIQSDKTLARKLDHGRNNVEFLRTERLVVLRESVMQNGFGGNFLNTFDGEGLGVEHNEGGTICLHRQSDIDVSMEDFTSEIGAQLRKERKVLSVSLWSDE